jgi:hypothetical protein
VIPNPLDLDPPDLKKLKIKKENEVGVQNLNNVININKSEKGDEMAIPYFAQDSNLEPFDKSVLWQIFDKQPLESVKSQISKVKDPATLNSIEKLTALGYIYLQTITTTTGRQISRLTAVERPTELKAQG